MANLALTYRNQYRWKDAEKPEAQVMETRKTKYGADHRDTLASMVNLALTYRGEGQRDAAEELEEFVSKTRRTVLEEGHPAC